MFEIESGLIFWTAVSFGLLVLLLYRWALPPLTTFLKQREELIAGQLQAAAESKQQAAALVEEQKKHLSEMRVQAEQIIARAKQEGEKLQLASQAQADKRAELILERAKQEIEQEKQKLITAVRQETAALVTLAAGKLLRRVITPAQHHQIIEETIAEANNESR
jgi:F-type H+-transporting ATPase subunit b